MPIVRVGKHEGCTVKGTYQFATGQAPQGDVFIHITPERGGVYHGRYYTNARASVKVEADGTWEAVLVPSEVMGLYRLKIGGDEFMLRVPSEKSEASFADLIVEAHGG